MRTWIGLVALVVGPAATAAADPAEINRLGTHWTLVGAIAEATNAEATADAFDLDSDPGAEALSSEEFTDDMRALAIFHDYPESLYVADSNPVTAAWLLANPDAAGGTYEVAGSAGGVYGTEFDLANTWAPSPGPMIALANTGLGSLSDLTLGYIVDGDQRVQQDNTLGLPFRTIVAIEASGYVGSGFIIGTNTIMTAAHVVFTAAGKKKTLSTWAPAARDGVLPRYPFWPGEAFPSGHDEAVPGYYVDAACPLHAGSNQHRCYCYDVFAPSGWKRTNYIRWDYAAIELKGSAAYPSCPDANPGGVLGTLAMHTATQQQTESLQGISVGYPGEDYSWPTQYVTKSNDIEWDGSNRLHYPLDLNGGQSGSPVYHWRAPHGGPDKKRLVISIVSSGITVDLFWHSNAGPRVNGTMLKFLQDKTSVAIHWD